MLKELPFRDAFGGTRRHKRRNWKFIADELSRISIPDFMPSFQMVPGSRVFTIGSCFARNMEPLFAEAGMHVPMLDFVGVPQSEYSGHILNKYTPPAIYQAVHWAARLFDAGGRAGDPTFDTEYSLTVKTAETPEGAAYYDLLLTGMVPVSRQRFFERRRQVYDVFQQLFTADVVVLTLGLAESWYSSASQCHWQSPLHHKADQALIEGLTLQQLDYETAYAYVAKALGLIRARNPAARFLISTSPVPLVRTFCGPDVRAESLYGKSMLRAVCGALAANIEGLDYFPSYEAAMLSPPELVWQEDRRHVSGPFIEAVGHALMKAYLPPALNPEEEALVAKAQQAASAGQAHAAIEAYEAIPERHRPYAVWVELGELQIGTNQPDSALEALRRAHRANPAASRPLNTMALLLSQLEEWEQAQEAIEKAFKLQPENPRVLKIKHLIDHRIDVRTSIATDA